ncbi:MAG: LppU/SCO3897 family protein, partial [Mycobacteriales bacterium]
HPVRGSRRGVIVAVALLAVLLLVICGVVGYLFLQRTSESSAHKTGKCVTRSGNTAKPVDCDDKGAYTIIKRLNNTQSDSGCPASQTELYFVNESSDYVLCLKKN